MPLLIDFQHGYDHFCYVVMERDISADPRFEGAIEKGKFFDYETPYGYGGPLCDQPISENAQRQFLKEFGDYAIKHGIVEQFIRFHPLLANQNCAPDIFETRYLHQTIYMTTSTPEQIMADMDGKNRNMVRKAMKSGVSIERRPIEDYNDFIPIYTETMNKDSADRYYYFSKDYFDGQSALRDHACIFYAMMDGRPIAGAIMYYNDRFMHYHLAGTYTEFRKYSPSNLLLYEAACWASEIGVKQFHLGGGIVEDDNLFGFKKQFNKNGRLPFYVGRTIFHEDSYQYLLRVRKKLDPSFNEHNNRMTQYRY